MYRISVAVVAESDLVLPTLQALGENVKGLFYTKPPTGKLIEYLHTAKIKAATFENLDPASFDLVILFECHKIVSKDLFSQSRWLNIHSGILPSWRGYSANSWAILNNAPEVGFTIHEIVEEYDSGSIVKIFSVKNDLVTNYQELRNEALKKLNIEIVKTIVSYINGEIELRNQSNLQDNIFYTSKILPSDGHLFNFDKPSNYLQNLSRLFVSSAKSDLFFCLPEKKLKIEKIEDSGNRYLGPANKILKIEEKKLLIKSSDGAVWIYPEDVEHFKSEYRKFLNSSEL